MLSYTLSHIFKATLMYVYVGENSKDIIFRSINLPNSPSVIFYNFVTLGNCLTLLYLNQ